MSPDFRSERHASKQTRMSINGIIISTFTLWIVSVDNFTLLQFRFHDGYHNLHRDEQVDTVTPIATDN